MADYQLFTYGTLRFGEHNAAFLSQAAYCGRHQTPAGYTLFDTGAYPAAVVHGGTSLIGDVYRISTETFALLDTLEGYPVFYSRRLIDTPFGNAWIYLWAADINPAWPAIASGDWCQHRRQREYALQGVQP